jgi:hypothetical protein
LCALIKDIKIGYCKKNKCGKRLNWSESSKGSISEKIAIFVFNADGTNEYNLNVQSKDNKINSKTTFKDNQVN